MSKIDKEETMKDKRYVIVEIPSGRIIELTTKHKNFLKLLIDAKKYLERKDLRKGGKIDI